MPSLYTDTDLMTVIGNNTKSNADEVRSNINKIYSNIDDLSSRWKGADNQAYVAKTNEYRPDMDKLVEVLDNFGTFLIDAANSYQSTQDSIINELQNL